MSFLKLKPVQPFGQPGEWRNVVKTMLNNILRWPLAGRGLAAGGFKLLLPGLCLLANLAVAQPANDNFASAVVISGISGTTNGNNVGATIEVGELAYVDTTDYGSEPVANSVWYKWQAPASRPVTFNTVGSSFDTVLAVYTTNASLAALTNLVLVTAEDDIAGTPWVYQSQVNFTAASNTTYYISVNTSVWGQDNIGSVQLNWSSASANTNIPTIPSGTFLFTTNSYTVSDTESSGAGNPAMNTVPPWAGARVTVTRTDGASGRVRVPYTWTVVTNQPNNGFTTNGVLVFDDYQMSADIAVPVGQDSTVTTNATIGTNTVSVTYAPSPGQITVTLGTPTLDSLESPDLLPPTIAGGSNSTTITILSDNHPATADATPFFNIERKTLRVQRTAGVATVVISVSELPPPLTANYTVSYGLDRGSANYQKNNFPLQAGSDYANPLSDFSDASGGKVSWSWTDTTLSKSIQINIGNNTNAVFNEDFEIELYQPVWEKSPNIPLALGQVNTATVTILYDKQPAGAVDRTWNKDGFNDSNPAFLQYPGALGGQVFAAVEQPDGKAIIAGSFNSFDSQRYNRIVRLMTNGYQDPTFLVAPNSGANDFITALAVRPDGKILIGGNFTAFNGSNRYHIARLNADGSLDTTFNPGLGANGIVSALALQTNGQVVIAGSFTSVNGTNLVGVARLNADGSVDASFNPGVGPDDAVNAVVVDSSGRVIIGGAFDQVAGLVRGGVARLNVDGTVDPTFDPGIGTYNAVTGGTDPVYALALQSNGQLVVGGSFAYLEMTAFNGLGRFNADGTLDTAFGTFGPINGTFNWQTGVADSVKVITLQPDGTILIGGDFMNINQTRRVGIARLFGDGSVDTSFMDTAYNQFAGIINHYHNPNAVNTNDYPSLNTRNAVYAIAVEPGTANVIIGGSFLRVGGGSYPHANSNPASWASTDGIYSEDQAAEHGIIFNGRMDIHPRSNVARLIGGGTVGPGNLEFAQSSYSVSKNSGTLNVALIRTNGNLGPVSATFYSPPGAAGQQGIATAGTDFAIGNANPMWDTMYNLGSWMYSTGFEGPSYNIFTPGDSANEILTILNNTNITGNLNANLSLTMPNSTLFMYLGGELIPLGAALGTLQASPLTIIDPNYLAGVLSFSSPTYIVNANGTNAVITVTRTNFTSGAVAVNYATSDGTATNGTNYTAASGTLSFGATDSSQTFTIPILPGSRTQPDRTVNLSLSTPTAGATLGQRSAVLTIVNNYNGNVHLGFVSLTNSISETGGPALIGVNRLGSSSGTVTVTAMTSNGTATNGLNYVGTTNVLMWNDSDVSTKFLSVPVLHDGHFTSNLTVNLSLTNATLNTTNYPAGLSYGGTNAVLVIANVDFPGAVEFTAGTYSVKKFGGFALIPVIRSGGSAGTITVGYSTVDGSAVSGVNYAGITNGLLTFTNGVVSQNFKVPILGAATNNGLLSLNLVLSNAVAVGSPAWPAQGSPSNAVLNIIDTDTVNEPPGGADVTYSPFAGCNGNVYALALQTNNQLLVAGDFTMADDVPRQRIARLNAAGGLDATFSLPSSAMGANDQIHTLAIQSDGRILVGGDFTKFNSVVMNRIARLNYDGSLDSQFNPGSGADNLVYAVAETFVNGARKILVAGAFSTLNGQVINGIGRLNDDGSPDMNFDSGGLGANGTVYVLVVQPDGRILIGGDFTAVNGITANHIARLNVDGSVDLTFTNATANDAVRAITLQLDGRILVGGRFSSCNGNTNFNHIARLNSDGSSDNNFTPTNGPGVNDMVSSIAVQSDARIVLGGEFTQASGVTRNRITRLNPNGTVDPTINFGVGADGFVAAVVVAEDTIAGYPSSVPDEKLIIGGGFLNYNGESHPYLARIYGGSLSGSGAFEFSSAAYSVNENGNSVSITINRTGGTSGTNADGSGNIYVGFATTNGTAQAGVNYSTVITNLAFPEGEVQQTVTIPVMDDQVVTSNLTVNLFLNPIAPAQYGDQPTAVLTIINIDSVINFSAATYLVNKYGTNIPNGYAFINVNRLGTTYGTSTVLFNTTTNGTAVAGLDYQPLTNVLVTFAPGVAAQTVLVPIINGVSDGNQTVSLQLTNVTGSVLYNPSNAVLTILDRTGAKGSLQFSAANYVVSEGGGAGFANATITVLRTNGFAGSVSVNYATVDGTAVAGVKYVATSGMLTFGDGETIKTFTVPVLNTPSVEPTEYFSVLLTNATGGVGLVSPTNAAVTILNTNTGIAFAAATNTFIETAYYANINVLRYNNTNGTATIHYSTTNGTAVAGINYQTMSGTLTFGSGANQAIIQVPLLYDTNATGPLQFTMGLSNPSPGVQVGTPGLTTVVLQDADAGLSFTSSSSSVLKNVGSDLVTVVCSNTNVEPVSVNYATANGTAMAGVDYTATSGTLTFNNGMTTNTFSVPIINSGAVNGDHWFTVSLSNPTGAGRLVSPSTQTNTIVDSNSGLRLSSATYSTLKTSGGAVITVYRSDNTNIVTTVNFTATNGTAINGLNFVATNGTLVFSNGATACSFTIPVIAASTVQPELTVFVQLFNPTNGILLNPSAATLTIQDNTGSYIIPAGAQIITNYTSLSDYTNGIIGTNDAVQVLFGFRDGAGNQNVTNLVATLLATNGVTPLSPVTTNYGPLINGGHSVSRPFTFTAHGSNQQQITATFMLQDGVNIIGTNFFTFSLGSWTTVFANTNIIVINDNSAASPYPSVISVSQVGGSLIKATVTLNKLTHTYPEDVSALVVSPSGNNTLIMAHAGSANSVTNIVLTFDDQSTNVLSASGRLVTSTNQPTRYGAVQNFP